MNGHMPECIYEPQHFDPEQNIVWGGKPCICDELRACEQRIRLADDDYAYVAGQAEADGRRRGWNEALDAAREAVAALDIGRDVRFSVDVQADALAAIDALKEKP